MLTLSATYNITLCVSLELKEVSSCMLSTLRTQTPQILVHISQQTSNIELSNRALSIPIPLGAYSTYGRSRARPNRFRLVAILYDLSTVRS